MVASFAARGLLPCVVTTNFDNCIEKAFDEVGLEYESALDDEGTAKILFRNLQQPNASTPAILKLHGSAEDGKSITALSENS